MEETKQTQKHPELPDFLRSHSQPTPPLSPGAASLTVNKPKYTRWMNSYELQCAAGYRLISSAQSSMASTQAS